MVFDMDADWPVPGWSLGFGKLVAIDYVDRHRGPFSFGLLLEADGTRHPAAPDNAEDLSNGDKRYSHHTTDGSRIDFKYDRDSQGRLFYAVAKYPNGTSVEFGAPSGLNEIYPTLITDIHG